MEETIENNPTADLQVAGATAGEQSEVATGNSVAASGPTIPEKFKSQEEFIKAYNELETYQIELAPKAKKGERYDAVVDALATSMGMTRAEVEAQLEYQLSNPTVAPAQQVQPSTADRKVFELERKMEWGEVVTKSPELEGFKDTILDYANTKQISVADAIKAFKPIFDSGKEAAKAKEVEKSEATVPTSTANGEQVSSLKRQYNDQMIRVQKIKSGEIEGNLRQENLTLLRLSDELAKQ